MKLSALFALGASKRTVQNHDGQRVYRYRLGTASKKIAHYKKLAQGEALNL